MFFSPFGTLAIRWHSRKIFTEIVPGEPGISWWVLVYSTPQSFCIFILINRPSLSAVTAYHPRKTKAGVCGQGELGADLARQWYRARQALTWVWMIQTHESACPGWPEWNAVCHCAVRATAPCRLRRMVCQYWITCNWLFHDDLYLILFQILGSTLHWVLVLYKLWGSTCCPGCIAVAAYMNRSSQQYELFHVVLLPNSNLLASTDVCCCCADVGLHVDATAYVFQLKFFQLRDHEW